VQRGEYVVGREETGSRIGDVQGGLKIKNGLSAKSRRPRRNPIMLWVRIGSASIAFLAVLRVLRDKKVYLFWIYLTSSKVSPGRPIHRIT